MKVIIRDDDISAATKPEMLELLYGRLWNAGFPICLSVIPQQSCNVLIQYMTPNIEYDFNVPPELRGKKKKLDIRNHPDLVEYLKMKNEQSKIEIVLHGLDHSYLEFLSNDYKKLDSKVKRGIQILESTFDFCVKTFVAPFDAISPIGIDIVLKNGLNLCTHSSKLLEHRNISQYLLARVDNWLTTFKYNQRTIYIADISLFDPIKHPEQSMNLALAALENIPLDGLLIFVNHYWSFFDDWGPPKRQWLRTWNNFIDKFLSIQGIEGVTFSTESISEKGIAEERTI